MTTKLSFWAFLAALAGALSLTGCTHPMDSFNRLTATDLTEPYIGRSKADIVACAGEPYGRYKTTVGENLIYRYSGAGPVPGKGSKDWTCSATMIFNGERLTEINYAHKDVESPYTEFGKKKPNLPHCTFSLPRCQKG
ncbi:MAG: hypothetical protein ACPW61_12475 [Methyloligella sp. ZOD6]